MQRERRSIRRWQVSIKAILEDSGQQPRQALISDISNKGAKLFLCKDINIGNEIDLLINLAHLGYVFVKAKAFWKQEEPDGSYIGFKFTQAKESERIKIFEYITHYYPEQVREAWFASTDEHR